MKWGTIKINKKTGEVYVDGVRCPCKHLEKEIWGTYMDIIDGKYDEL